MKTLVPLCIEVLKDWRVIAITIFLIFYIALVNYVVRYHKKPHVPKPKAAPVSAAPAEGEKKDEAKKEGDDKEGGEE